MRRLASTSQPNTQKRKLAMNKDNKCNWQVIMYDDQDNEIGQFVIENRSEREAEREAMHDSEVQGASDWSMTSVTN